MHDDRAVAITHSFCKDRLAKFGYKKLFLIGSRVGSAHRLNSDHDFVAVVDDSSPSSILIGGSMAIFTEFDLYRRYEGVGPIDLLIVTESRVSIRNPEPEDFIPYNCQNNGKLIWSAEGDN